MNWNKNIEYIWVESNSIKCSHATIKIFLKHEIINETNKQTNTLKFAWLDFLTKSFLSREKNWRINDIFVLISNPECIWC